MGTLKQINIKNRTYQFYNDIIDLVIVKLISSIFSFFNTKNIGIYNIGYVTIKKFDDCKNMHSVNPLYLLVNHATGYIEEKGVNKYSIFDSADENKELLKKQNDVWGEIRDKIKEVSSGECNYEKDYMEIKFNSDDDFPLNKPLKFRLMTITIISVLEEDGKLYPQVFLDDALYKLNV